MAAKLSEPLPRVCRRDGSIRRWMPWDPRGDPGAFSGRRFVNDGSYCLSDWNSGQFLRAIQVIKSGDGPRGRFPGKSGAVSPANVDSGSTQFSRRSFLSVLAELMRFSDRGTGVNTEKQFPCEFCGRAFSQGSEWERHVLRHGL